MIDRWVCLDIVGNMLHGLCGSGATVRGERSETCMTQTRQPHRVQGAGSRNLRDDPLASLRFPIRVHRLAEVSFMADTFHSGSRLDKASETAMTSKGYLIDLSGGHLLNQLNEINDQSRNLVDTCAIIMAWSATSFSKLMTTHRKKRGPPGLGSLNVMKIERGAFYEQAPNPTSGIIVGERQFRV
jgi:hypothetical protein